MREEVIQVDNFAFDVDGRLRIYRVSPPPPPSRAESSLSIQFSLPGYIEEETHVGDEDTENLPPPPSYLDCTIPPPVYDDLYPAPRPPKSPKRITRRTWFKMISILGFASLATSLLLIATRSVITQSCTGTPFLIVWCFVSSFIIWSGLTLTVSKKIRKKLNESTSVRPLVLYVVSIFCVSWLVGGSVISFEIIGKIEDCSSDVTSVSFATCVIGFVFGVLFICFEVSG